MSNILVIFFASIPSIIFNTKEELVMAELRDGRMFEFFILENAVIDREDLDIYEKFVYITLCRYAHNNEGAFPSYNTIATKSSISRRKAISTVASLVEKELVHKQIRKTNGTDENDTNLYTIMSAKLPSAPDAPPKESGSAQDSPQVMHDMHHPSAPDAPKKELIKNNYFKNQSINQDDEDLKPTDGLTESFSNPEDDKTIERILQNGNVEMYDGKLFISQAISKLWKDRNLPYKLQMGLKTEDIQERLRQLKQIHIDNAIAKMQGCKTNKELYFMKCLLTSIVESPFNFEDEYEED